jgi:hypothetical protein
MVSRRRHRSAAHHKKPLDKFRRSGLRPLRSAGRSAPATRGRQDCQLVLWQIVEPGVDRCLRDYETASDANERLARYVPCSRVPIAPRFPRRTYENKIRKLVRRYLGHPGRGNLLISCPEHRLNCWRILTSRLSSPRARSRQSHFGVWRGTAPQTVPNARSSRQWRWPACGLGGAPSVRKAVQTVSAST